MKVLYNWLEDIANTKATPQEVGDKLTMLGMEVESIEEIGGAKDFILVGEVVSVEKHPDADKLSVCQVKVPGETLQIVCGADNVKAGIHVPVALVGAEFDGNFKIKKAKLRGVESNGMICSKEELGIEEKSAGIWDMGDQFEIGTKPEEFLGEKDYLFDVDITSNRSDCLSVMGLAREAVAGFGTEMSKPKIKLEIDKNIEKPDITIESKDLCSRYSSRIIKGVKIKKSPDWLVKRLERSGIRSINNVVDVTNYVLWEYGHPLHAFDLNKLADKKIIVRNAKEGEKIVTLDEQERELKKEMLVIADGEKAVAIAGIMGGSTSEVDDNTVDLLIESAYFDAITIRRASKKLNLVSEASYRFARYADPEITITALDRAVELIIETAGGVAGELTDNVSQPYKQKEVVLTRDFVKMKLGVAIPIDECASILEKLEFEIIDKNETQLVAIVPSFRSDVSMNADLVEEICRIWGYDKIPTKLFPVRINEAVLAGHSDLKFKVQDFLVEKGLQEVINFNFVQVDDLDLLKLSADNCVDVKNPMSNDQRYLRPSLLPNMLKNLKTNVSHGRKNLAMFEFGKIFSKVSGDKVLNEATSLAVLLYGYAELPGWDKNNGKSWDFYDLSGILDYLLRKFFIKNYKIERTERDGFHPGRTAKIMVDGHNIGFLGELHPSVLKELDVQQRVYMMELDPNVLDSAAKDSVECSLLSKFPSLYRDLAFVLARDVDAQEVIETIKRVGSHLESVRLMSVYTGEQIDADKKSLAFTMSFVNEKRTLSDDEIEAIQTKIIKAVSKKHNGLLR